MIIKSYVYKITFLDTGEYYIGSRGSNINDGVKPEKDLWVRYFSSSRAFKKMIREYGKAAFEPEIMSKHKDEALAHKAAEKLIGKHLDNELCLNNKFQREDGVTYEQEQERRRIADEEKAKKLETKKRRSEAQKKAWEKRRKKQEEKA